MTEATPSSTLADERRIFDGYMKEAEWRVEEAIALAIMFNNQFEDESKVHQLAERLRDLRLIRDVVCEMKEALSRHEQED